MKTQEIIIGGDFNVHMDKIMACKKDKTSYEKSLNRISNI